MPKITSSSNRSKRSTKKPVTQGQNPQRANRQQMSQAKVSSASNGKPSNPGSAKVTTGMGSRLATAAKVAKAVGAVKGLTPIGIAYETLKARPLASGTLKGKATGATQGPAVPKRLTQSGINKGSFDDAFRNARKAKMKEFTWRGKRYNTKLKEE